MVNNFNHLYSYHLFLTKVYGYFKQRCIPIDTDSRDYTVLFFTIPPPLKQPELITQLDTFSGDQETSYAR